jgi:hypothetical protein
MLNLIQNPKSTLNPKSKEKNLAIRYLKYVKHHYIVISPLMPPTNELNCHI